MNDRGVTWLSSSPFLEREFPLWTVLMTIFDFSKPQQRHQQNFDFARIFFYVTSWSFFLIKKINIYMLYFWERKRIKRKWKWTIKMDMFRIWWIKPCQYWLFSIQNYCHGNVSVLRIVVLMVMSFFFFLHYIAVLMYINQRFWANSILSCRCVCFYKHSCSLFFSIV